MSQMKASRMIRLTLVSTSVAAALMLAGCSVIAPEKLSSDDLMRLANVDQQLMFAAQEPVTAPITMEEAVARALKYNLEHRLAMMERAVQENIADVQSMSLLPKLTASAGYRDRSNELASSSESLATGKESLVPSKSSERYGRTADLELSWNVLDFGLSYFEAQASTNKSYASEERRRRVVADIARQTRAAWLSAVSAERLRDEVADALDDASKALAQSKEAGGRGLVKPLDALRYQRDLLNMVRQLETLEDELVKSKAKLATLMNLQPGTPFQLAVPSTDTEAVPAVPYKLSDLEVLAMVRRPEIREESYLARNAVLETRMSLLKLFPNVQLFAGLNYDSNKYLANNDWADVGTQVSWNLMSLFTAPKILKGGELREELAPLRRQAIRMTVLSQVHVAWHQRFAAEKAFRRADELSRVQNSIDKQVENAVKSRSETKLEAVRTKVETLLAKRTRDLSYAEMLNAQDAIYQAAGFDTVPAEVADQSISGLAEAIGAQDRIIADGAVLQGLYGTGLILIIVFVVRSLPTGTRSGISALRQIDKSIEESAYDMGADSFKVFMTVTLPLIKDSFLSGLVTAFVRSITAISAIILLVTPQFLLITVQINEFAEKGSYSLACAFATILIVITYGAVLLMNLFMNHFGTSKKMKED